MTTASATGQQPPILRGRADFDPGETAKVQALNDAEQILTRYLGPSERVTDPEDIGMFWTAYTPEDPTDPEVVALIRDGLLYRRQNGASR